MKDMNNIGMIIKKLSSLGKVEGDNESLSHEENLSGFFASKGHPSALKNNEYQPLRSAHESTRKHVARYNSAHGLKITPTDIYAALGAEQSLQTNPADRKFMQELADFVSENILNGRDVYNGFLNSPLYIRIKNRASHCGIPLEEYMDTLGYQRGNAKINGRKVIETKSNADVIASIQDVFDDTFKEKDENGKILTSQITSLDAETLKKSGLYDWLRHKREAIGFAMEMSIAEFINTQLKGYIYSGRESIQNVDKSKKSSITSVILPAKE